MHAQLRYPRADAPATPHPEPADHRDRPHSIPGDYRPRSPYMLRAMGRSVLPLTFSILTAGGESSSPRSWDRALLRHNVNNSDRARLHLVLLDLRHRLPVEPDRVLDRVQLGRRAAVVDGIEPVIAFEPLGGLVLVGAQEDFPDAGPAFHLDEADLGERLRVFGMRLAGDEVKPPVVGFDALDDEPPALLVLGGDS